jgi:hypothetical protein
MTTPPLFAECILPGCCNPVDTALTACPECVTAFGPMLHQTAVEVAAEEMAEAIAERDEAVRAIQRERLLAFQPIGPAPEPRPEPAREEKRNQLCWCCEERRTCRIDLDDPNRWICKTCEPTQ